jgi:UDP-N-acetylmuramate--alanine ligase
MTINELKTVYFLGIGGIGMSALARYFINIGVSVYGYDLNPTDITDNLTWEGAIIHFDENISEIPENTDLVIYTPAINKQHAEYQYFLKKNIPILKRSQMLGMISDTAPTMAVAGTHGKTTTTAMISHLLNPEEKIIAFIGGISKNLNSNFVMNSPYSTVVAEADEYDRSFLTLHPATAVITSMDADHLDIYGGKKQLEESFQLFAGQVNANGTVIINESVYSLIEHPHKISYGVDPSSDFYATDVRLFPNKAIFNIHFWNRTFENVQLSVTGSYNVLNAVAAFAAVWMEFERRGMPVDTNLMLKKLATFSGVKRRFDFQIEKEDLVFIDDYAHHPEEIRAFITAVRNVYPTKKITGIFQPHLFSRTRDFGAQFAEVLALLDKVILLEIYPARELPIPGIDANWLLNQIGIKEKILLAKEELIPYLKENRPEVLVTIGAGNIDKLVPEIKESLE